MKFAFIHSFVKPSALKVTLVATSMAFAGTCLAQTEQEMLSQGQGIFLQSCSLCHGRDGSGGATVDIRKIPAEEIELAIQGFEQMPEIILSPTEIQSLAEFLATL